MYTFFAGMTFLLSKLGGPAWHPYPGHLVAYYGPVYIQKAVKQEVTTVLQFAPNKMLQLTPTVGRLNYL